jgi:hypothetical protein
LEWIHIEQLRDNLDEPVGDAIEEAAVRPFRESPPEHLECTVNVPTLRSLTVAQWIGETQSAKQSAPADYGR